MALAGKGFYLKTDHAQRSNCDWPITKILRASWSDALPSGALRAGGMTAREIECALTGGEASPYNG